jgi:uncharacterized protein with HEPN domain
MAYRDVSVWLEDILMAIEKIESYTKDIESYSKYVSSQITVDATERNLEIIAEALKNAIKLKPDLAISDTKKIIGLRNIINHQYYEVEHDRIWIVIKKNLPVLGTEVRKILEDYERRLELNEL